MSKTVKRIMKWAVGIILLPVALVLLLGVLLYVPAVQNYVVDKVAESLSDSTGLSFSIDRVRLGFPLDLEVQGVRATQRGDSVLRAKELRLDVEFWPLFSGQANVSGITLRDAGVNTRDLISNTQIIGTVGEVKADVKGINWKENKVIVPSAELRNSDVTVLLCDTAAEDTTKGAPWLIKVDRAQIENTRARLTLPNDSLHIFANIGDAEVRGASFDTGKPLYEVGSLTMSSSTVFYDAEWRDRNLATQWQPDMRRTERGLDFNHIHLDSLDLSAEGFSYNEFGVLRLGLRNLAVTELVSGFRFESLEGDIYYDPERIRVNGLHLTTPYSNIDGEVSLLFAALDSRATGANNMTTSINSRIGWQDVKLLGKGFVPDELLRNWPHYQTELNANVSGNVKQLTINDLYVKTPYSKITGSVFVQPSALDAKGYIPANPGLKLNVQTVIGWQDVLSFGKPYLPQEILKNYPHYAVSANVNGEGNLHNIKLRHITLKTPYSSIDGAVSLNLDAFSGSRGDAYTMNVKSKIGWRDALAFGGPYMPKELRSGYPHYDIALNVNGSGNTNHISIKEMLLRTPHSTISGSGNVNFAALSGGRSSGDAFNLNIKSKIGKNDVNVWSKPFVSGDVAKLLPPYDFTLNGEIRGNLQQINTRNLFIKTPYSQIQGDGMVNIAALSNGGTHGEALNLRLNTKIGWADIAHYGGPFLSADMMRQLPHSTYTLNGHVTGNLNNLNMSNMLVGIPGVGQVSGDFALNSLSGGSPSGTMNVNITGQNMDLINRLLPDDLRETIHIPNGVSAKGKIEFRADNYCANLNIAQGGGTAHVNGCVNTRTETYDATVTANHFPLQNFLPDMGMRNFTGDIAANGNGFNVLEASSRLAADIDIKDFKYENYDLNGVIINAKNHNGTLIADFTAKNDMINGSGKLTAHIGNEIEGHLDASFPFINLTQLAQLEDTVEAGGNLDVTFHSTSDFTRYGASGSMSGIHYTTNDYGYMTNDFLVKFNTQPDSTTIWAQSGDLLLDYRAEGDLTYGFTRLANSGSEMADQISKGHIDELRLSGELPAVDLNLHIGKNNPSVSFLKTQGITFDEVSVNLNTTPETGLNGFINVKSLQKDHLMLDTAYAVIGTDSTGFFIDGMVHNFKRKNPNKFKASLKASLNETGANVEAMFKDKDGATGVDLGVMAEILENGYKFHLYPKNPILAYRTFSINDDNYVYIGNDNKIGADINLLADDGTGLKVNSEPGDSINDITLSLSNINLQELSNCVPYIPYMKGLLSGDIHVSDDHKQISAMANLNFNDLEYEGTYLGNVGVEGIYLPKEGNEHYASAFITTSNQDVMSVEGTYNTATEMFTADGNMHDFPLQFINGFLSGTDVKMRGIGMGDFAVSGKTNAPVINGKLSFNDGHIYSDVYGFDFKMEETPVVISNSRMKFDNYQLLSTGINPLFVNGNLDMSDFSRIALDFDLKAKDFELINTNKNKESMLYGKLFTDLNATMRGNTADGLSLRGNLNVLPKTDLTYILKDSPLTVEDQMAGLVKFVDFSDTTSVEEEIVDESTNFDMTFGVNIDDNAHLLCLLSEDGRNYLDVRAGGSVTLRQNHQGDMRMLGKLTVNKGEMKYELPVIPLKTFTIEEGSSIEFRGDIENPALDITAKERVKALVTENDQQRTVAFDVGIDISKTLNNMGLNFTIDAPEDLSIQNQLAAMGAEERNKVAVAMLATGMYLTNNMQSSSGFKASNALNAFLQSEIQNIAGNALKTIDVSVGVESGTSTTGTATTDYAFQFSKRFWGDRISVIIGGRVSTGADADNSAESFIDNIAVEYRLDSRSAKQLKVFYNRQTIDPLEGQLTKAGVGLVLRRKSNTLGDLFIFSRKKNKENKE